MKARAIITGLVLLAVASNASAVLDIVVSFDDNTWIWTAQQKAVVNQAVTDWEDAFSAYDLDATVTFGIDFRNVGGGAAAVTYGWDVGWAFLPVGFDSRPWQYTGHYIGILPNSFWWDPTPANDFDNGAQNSYDALTLIRHEMGHMLGSQPGLYFSDTYTPSQVDAWTAPIVGNIFDPGGLNVTMSGGDLGHTSGGLMDPWVAWSRRDVDLTMQMIALAFDLQPIPEPMTMTLLAVGGVALLKRRRRA